MQNVRKRKDNSQLGEAICAVIGEFSTQHTDGPDEVLKT